MDSGLMARGHTGAKTELSWQESAVHDPSYLIGILARAITAAIYSLAE